MSVPLYRIKFFDGSEYVGGDIIAPKWRESPDKPIQSLELRLPTGDFLLLGDYKEYNLFVECLANLVGSNGSRLTFLYIMGLRDEVVTSYRIALADYGQYRAGDLTVRRFPRGKEYDGKPTAGWHK